MEFIKTVIKNRKLVWQLGKNDFKNRFANTSLGSIWGFLQPFVFMFTYVIVFQYILKTGSSGNDPYIVWFLPGMAMWQSLNDGIISASGSIRAYSYLVKKVVFPIDIIPIISIIASSFVALFLFANATKQERNTAAIEAASSIQEENIQNIENYNNEYFIQNME